MGGGEHKPETCHQAASGNQKSPAWRKSALIRPIPVAPASGISSWARDAAQAPAVKWGAERGGDIARHRTRDAPSWRKRRSGRLKASIARRHQSRPGAARRPENNSRRNRASIYCRAPSPAVAIASRNERSCKPAWRRRHRPRRRKWLLAREWRWGVSCDAASGGS